MSGKSIEIRDQSIELREKRINKQDTDAAAAAAIGVSNNTYTREVPTGEDCAEILQMIGAPREVIRTARGLLMAAEAEETKRAHDAACAACPYRVEDALKGLWYVDDSQIVGYGAVGKWYDKQPRIEITRWEIPTGREV